MLGLLVIKRGKDQMIQNKVYAVIHEFVVAGRLIHQQHYVGRDYLRAVEKYNDAKDTCGKDDRVHLVESTKVSPK
jgi:hypothetical protein